MRRAPYRIVRFRLSDRKIENIGDLKNCRTPDHRNDRGLVWTCSRRLSSIRPRYQHPEIYALEMDWR